MKIVLTSKSKVKVAALDHVLRKYYPSSSHKVTPVSVTSDVPEQPFGDEAFQGALNRIKNAKKEIPDAGLYISIENGIFIENGEFVDRAIAVCSGVRGQDALVAVQSSGVVFPSDCVEEAGRRGFDEWTVGKVMAEKGVVEDHADPHLSLRGKSRKEFIQDALINALDRWAG